MRGSIYKVPSALRWPASRAPYSNARSDDELGTDTGTWACAPTLTDGGDLCSTASGLDAQAYSQCFRRARIQPVV